MKKSTVNIYSVFIMTIFLLINFTVNAQKDDTLYFLNGDRISGEIKQFKYGYLTYKTYGVSTVKVKIDKISTFYSKKSFDILFKDGRRRFGSFDTSYMAQFVKIVITNDSILTPLIEIVEITPIKKKFWSNIDGSVDLGFSYTRANTLSQLTLNSNITYTQRKYITNFKFNSINSIQNNKDSSRTKKNDINGNFYRLIKGNWYGIGLASAEQNTELGLDLRLQGGVGLANELVHTNRHNFVASLGFVANKEWSATSNGTRINADGYMSINYKLFRFEDPEIDITTSAIAFPSFTIAGRWRVNYDIQMKFKIITDMFFSISFYTNYDSRPPSDAPSNVDYSLTVSFGYTF